MKLVRSWIPLSALVLLVGCTSERLAKPAVSNMRGNDASDISAIVDDMRPRVRVTGRVHAIHVSGLTGATLIAPARDKGSVDIVLEGPEYLRGVPIGFVF